VKTDVSEPQMAQAVIEAWKDLFGKPPGKEQVAMVIAQNNLETGHRKAMWNYNVGNLTTNGQAPFDYFDDLTTDEQTSPGQWKKMNLKYRAYPSLEAGTRDYLRLISGGRYSEAWKHIIDPDPIAYSKALHTAGYYTANEAGYTKAMTALYNQSNKSDSYELALSGKVSPPGGRPATTRPTAPPSQVASLEDLVNKYVQMLAAADHHMKRLYKKALPNHDILIKITAPDYTSAVEFSRVLCAALDEDLLSTSYVYTDGQDVEVECCIPGPDKECFAAVEQMTQAVAETFQDATIKIGGISIKAECVMNKKSSYEPISLRTAGTNYRKFLLKFV
jgi:hypothetical protein